MKRLIYLILLIPCLGYSQSIQDRFADVHEKYRQKNQACLKNLGDARVEIDSIFMDGGVTYRELPAYLNAFSLFREATLIIHYEDALATSAGFMSEELFYSIRYRDAKENWSYRKKDINDAVKRTKSTRGEIRSARVLKIIDNGFIIADACIKSTDNFYEEYYNLLPNKIIQQTAPDGKIIEYKIER